MKSIAITQFKAQCLALLEDLSRTGEPLEITKRGKPLARVVPSAGEKTRHMQASLAGTVTGLSRGETGCGGKAAFELPPRYAKALTHAFDPFQIREVLLPSSVCCRKVRPTHQPFLTTAD